MNAKERMEVAQELLHEALRHIIDAQESPDTVVERRHLVRAATRLRAAASYLDDEGRLNE